MSSSIYEACVFYELPENNTQRAVRNCHVLHADARRLEGLAGDGETLPVRQYNVYKQMLADWFKIDAEKAVSHRQVRARGQKEVRRRTRSDETLIVVDKLLTGFDAPSATYLYIDKQMRDHGLFQAICRVNRLDGDDKEYGYVIDYKDLFKSLEGAVKDYTSEALDQYDKEDVEGLLKDRVAQAKEHLEDALEAIRALVEPVEKPKDSAAYLRYFCTTEPGDAAQLKDNEPKRVELYKSVSGVVRAFAARRR